MIRFKPHTYQQTAIDFLLTRLYLDDEPGAGLFLDPGLGKTSITLETLWQMRRRHAFKKALIVAPLRVCYSVWPKEIAKWGYPLRSVIVHGDAKARQNALYKNADIYLINPEGLLWLARQYDTRLRCRMQFDWLVVDESTKFKNWSARRTRAIHRLCKGFKKRLILTGTPAPKSYEDLVAQTFIIDEGKALGDEIGKFRNAYCARGGYEGRGFNVLENRYPEIEQRIAPMILTMRCEDHLDMPRRLDHFIEVELPPKIRKAYDEIEAQLFALLESGERLEASNAGHKYSLCRQIANGGAYEDDILFGGRRTIHAHDAKTEALVDLADELNGKPLLVAYQFDHDADRLSKAFPDAPVIRGGLSPKKSDAILERWNKGDLQVLLVQPQALSHGANMQFGGSDLAWYGHTDQLEVFQQFNARLWRQGQAAAVRFHHVQAARTVDLAVWDRLQSKDETQEGLLTALKNYRKAS